MTILVVDMQIPKSCMECPLCGGEYGPGNDKSYCKIKPYIKLTWKNRPKECPIRVVKE
jgi:hypothetical protein